jgi:YD repeat-containing protein
VGAQRGGLGTQRTLLFNSASYVVSDTLGANQGTLAETTTYTRDSSSNFVTDQYDQNVLIPPVTGTARHTIFAYDSLGNLLSVTRAAGTSLQAITSYTYDSAHCYFVQTVTDPISNVTTKTYDSSCNLSSSEDGNLNTTTFPSYNAQGQVLTMVSPMNEPTTYMYDSYGDQIAVTDPLGHSGTKTYDAAGRVASSTDGLGNTTTFAYDNVGRLASTTPPNSGASGPTLVGYDSVGNSVSMTDANNNIWTWGL